jgi:hypothetical protein
VSIPHTVRRRVCAISPTTSPTNVWNAGAVKHGRNAARRPASEHGAVRPGGATDHSHEDDPDTGRYRRLSANQNAVNTAHARQRRPGERANAELKSWKVLRKIRSSPQPGHHPRRGRSDPDPRQLIKLEEAH